MKKVFINRAPVEGPWGGGNLFVRSFWELSPKFGFTPQTELNPSVDVVLLVEPRDDGFGPSFHAIQAYLRQHPSIKLVHRVNECDARKATSYMDSLLQQCSASSTASVFVSNWLQEYHDERGWLCPLRFVAYNGVEKSIFKAGKKFDDGKVHLVTHHWSDNLLKGFDIYNALDRWVGENPGFTFTYIGRERGGFSNTKVVPPLFGDALGAELGRYDVYISASRFDPGPNHILESLSCNMPTYVFKDGGGCVEFAGNSHSYGSFEELTTILRARQFARNNAIVLLDWDECIQQYCGILKQVVS